MKNVGATWEQIVSLARALDCPLPDMRAEDHVELARLVLDFHQRVVGRPLKRHQDEGATG
jgi:hypothetical protein